MIEVKNLKKSYGSFEVLKGISFSVDKGTVSGFLGPNGAGKSTTMNILTGLIGYNGGEICIDGKNFELYKKELMKKVGYLNENPTFYGYMNAYEYLSFIGRISGYPAVKLKKRVEELLEGVKLKAEGKRRISGYSKGMKQRLGLAAAMMNDPELIFLDEPTSALDPEGRMDMLGLIENLKKQGKTVFLSTHILSDVERVCDRVDILNHGEIVLSSGLEELKNSFIQPVYDIEFEENCEEIADNLKGEDFVDKVKVSGTRISVFVKDINSINNRLLSRISKYDNRVVSYNLRKSDLEDIFMRLVK